MKTIDYRSDTVTWPTPKMQQAISSTLANNLGDDVYGEDPTTNNLQEKAAIMFGKEAALLVPSGTFANLCSILTHCARGDEVIVGRDAHIFKQEVAGAAMYGGIQCNPLDVQRDGTIKMETIAQNIRKKNIHFPPTRLICLENTQGGAGGAPLSKEYTDEVAALAHFHGAKLHIDGARIFNAATALKISVDELTQNADSISVCLSKGLCAPIGSLIVGSSEFIDKAKKIRKSLGGGLRQTGVFASAGLIALEEMSLRLEEDHENARLLAEGLASISHIEVDRELVRTNMISFLLKSSAPISPPDFIAKLERDHNIIIRSFGATDSHFRLVTHYWIRRDHIHQTLSAITKILQDV